METDVVQLSDLKKVAPVFGQTSFDDHEQVVFCNDKDTGLKAIIGIHNTVLGPALGGTRMWQYTSEWDALNDVLRLSRGMTFKSAITGLNLGGGKAVIIGDAKTQKTPELMIRFGEFVHSLGGKYITAEDVGMKTEDMDLVRTVTPYVTGISEEKGGAGNPSPITAFGVFMGMKAAAKHAFGTDVLEDRVIYVQGIGNVGEALVEHLSNEGAQVYVSDINQDRLEEVRDKYGVNIYGGNNLYAEEMDIYAPCALGATVNDLTIDQLKAKVIAGAANNQLEEETRHGAILREKGIVYAPDFLINAGGIINVYAELENYGRQEIIRKTENIYNTTLEILSKAERNDITTHQAALAIATSRIEARKKEK
ncbi:Glu/Leu/Phe/Val family dehydrogenase [Altibacter sp. HG106]|uniref:Glu/Leu/Phe/Val family dehydrogenase n=1 Tax=Altibacter sp. HG106 TaxID=3023937 RepID=UPI00234FF00B|nr:Glu/Leu/Phe/Val dehydrogenase dimerization domain-containing protein [Altibacter sp. HG106]MDC7996261.1 Glu/Leu/Phe/Val dehydrogenase dimerization domain-containing protein [Altibacter sp. HG106]